MSGVGPSGTSSGIIVAFETECGSMASLSLVSSRSLCASTKIKLSIERQWVMSSLGLGWSGRV